VRREKAGPKFWERFRLGRILGFDSNFTKKDKWVAGTVFAWSIGLMTVNIIVTTWNLAFSRWSMHSWATYWAIVGIGMPFAISVATLIWFTVGGISDTRSFMHALRTMKRDDTDDGHVERAIVGPNSSKLS
jgi:SSS family solute:Na+ symporter